MSRFDALLCDLDGVLRHWDPRILLDLDEAYGLAPGTLAATAFSEQRLHPATTGEDTDQQWRSHIAHDLTALCGSPSAAQSMVREWSAALGEVDTEVARLLSDARAHIPVVLVSNATTRLEEDLDQLGLTDCVDDVVNSARVGVAKPDERIYRHAAERAGVAVTRCLFVDDLIENVAAARSLGMAGLHFQHAGQLREVLTEALEISTSR